MNEFRYQAFISYSHQDRAWAEWLHRALESYRIPRQLRRQLNEDAGVASSGKLTPVFLDRDELSSASDLSQEVSQALAASRCLLVICSPAAAESRWVNEEIRRFQALGRSQRIFCVVVDGEAASHDCFPPALLDSTGDGQADHEPLAADPRAWADGKPLALLKVVSAMLGVRLDHLRQRELHRRHRRWALAACVFGLVAVVTSILAYTAMQARDEAELSRTSMKQSLDFQLSELEQQRGESTLEAQEAKAQQVANLLDALDPEHNNADYQLRRARNDRFLGHNAVARRNLDEALSNYRASLEVLSNLHAASPQSPDLLFELGAAEFWVASVFREKGDYTATLAPLGRYLEIARQGQLQEPGDQRWTEERMYAHSSLATVMIESGSNESESLMAHISEAMQLNQQLLHESGNDSYFSGELAETYSWRAQAWLQQCQLKESKEDWAAAVRLRSELSDREPGKRKHRERIQGYLTGLATVEYLSGDFDGAMQHSSEALSLIRNLSETNPSDASLRWRWLVSRTQVARMARETEPSDGAIQIELAKVIGLMEDMIGRGEAARFEHIELARALGMQASMLRNDQLMGPATEANDERIRLLRNYLADYPGNTSYQVALAEAQVFKAQLQADASGIAEIRHQAVAHSCEAAGVQFQLALLNSDQETARSLAGYLSERGYRHPDFVALCVASQFCEEEAI